MPNIDPLEYSANLLSTTDRQDQHIHSRLALYQVFSRIYDQNKDLLNEILDLENSGNHFLSLNTTSYIQGLVIASTVYLVTNVLMGKTQILDSTNKRWVIGRNRQATLPIADRRLSRRHAVITYDTKRQQFQLSDLGSTNGTFLNDEPILKSRYLQDGDRIRFGGLGLTFFTLQLPASATAIPCEPESEINVTSIPPLPSIGSHTQESPVDEPNAAASSQNTPQSHPLASQPHPEGTAVVPRPRRL